MRARPPTARRWVPVRGGQTNAAVGGNQVRASVHRRRRGPDLGDQQPDSVPSFDQYNDNDLEQNPVVGNFLTGDEIFDLDDVLN